MRIVRGGRGHQRLCAGHMIAVAVLMVMVVVVRIGMDGGGVNRSGLLLLVLLLLRVTRRGDAIPVQPEVLFGVGDERAQQISRWILEGGRRDGA